MPLPGLVGQSRFPDFEVAVTFLAPNEGGRATPAHQGYRPDMVFDGHPGAWMIHPEFLREDGTPYALHESVPSSVHANMYVLYLESRAIVRPLASARSGGFLGAILLLAFNVVLLRHDRLATRPMAFGFAQAGASETQMTLRLSHENRSRHRESTIGRHDPTRPPKARATRSARDDARNLSLTAYRR